MATGQAFCRHCEQAIRPDGLGGWVHVLRGYPCHDAAGVRLGTYADLELPPPPPSAAREWPPINRHDREPGAGREGLSHD